MDMPIEFNKWSHVTTTPSGSLVLFREVGERSNPNPELADSTWQFMLAYPSWYEPDTWSMLSPTWLCQRDDYFINLLQVAQPLSCVTYATCVKIVLAYRKIAQATQATRESQLKLVLDKI